MKDLKHIGSLSELLKVAVEDMAFVKKDKRYKFNVDEWHTADWFEGVCHVCIAGAVIAGTLGASPEYDRSPFDYDWQTYDKLIMLDCIRKGESFQGKYNNVFNKEVDGVFIKAWRSLPKSGLRTGNLNTWRKLARLAEECDV